MREASHGQVYIQLTVNVRSTVKGALEKIPENIMLLATFKNSSLHDVVKPGRDCVMNRKLFPD